MSMFDDHGDVRPGRAWIYGLTTALVLFVILPIGLWAFGVFASGPKGTGDVHRKNQDANNRIGAQATFEKLAGDIQAYPVKIANAAGDRTAHPDDTYYATVLTGLESACADATATYNADAQMTTMRDWRPANLPESYDNTICEASK